MVGMVCWLLLWPSGLLLAVVCGRAVGFGLVACEGYCLAAMFRYSTDLCHCTWLWLCSLWFAVALLPWWIGALWLVVGYGFAALWLARTLRPVVSYGLIALWLATIICMGMGMDFVWTHVWIRFMDTCGAVCGDMCVGLCMDTCVDTCVWKRAWTRV